MNFISAPQNLSLLANVAAAAVSHSSDARELAAKRSALRKGIQRQMNISGEIDELYEKNASKAAKTQATLNLSA